ncbi:hypothetical protein GH714_028223 [Hevea brasiliensis]|uniref:Protein FAR1-RELATED SEQUENCE n=1 Tax=Hevea brasiliensis TaxID=3981 RepID=A0A6A6LMX6_HEVBR|nr:hypothetical protein GH714_028223 [Hevea brasiliensis]
MREDGENCIIHGIRDDDSQFDENSLSDEPSSGANGTPSHGDQDIMMQESQSGGDGHRSNIHEDEIAYNVKEGPKIGMHFPTMDNLGNFYKEHARIVSTQRSEGMHACFDGYANARSTLKQFIEQYEMAICGTTENELLSEFISKTRLLTAYLHLDGKDSFNMRSLMKCSSWFKSKLSAYGTMIETSKRDEESNKHGMERYNILKRCIIND